MYSKTVIDNYYTVEFYVDSEFNEVSFFVNGDNYEVGIPFTTAVKITKWVLNQVVEAKKEFYFLTCFCTKDGEESKRNRAFIKYGFKPECERAFYLWTADEHYRDTIIDLCSGAL